MSRWAAPLAPSRTDELIGTAARVSALNRYADDLEQRIAAGDTDPDLPEEARAARAAAIIAEAA